MTKVTRIKRSLYVKLELKTTQDRNDKKNNVQEKDVSIIETHKKLYYVEERWKYIRIGTNVAKKLSTM
jgi:hypothetical protein